MTNVTDCSECGGVECNDPTQVLGALTRPDASFVNMDEGWWEPNQLTQDWTITLRVSSNESVPVQMIELLSFADNVHDAVSVSVLAGQSIDGPWTQHNILNHKAEAYEERYYLIPQSALSVYGHQQPQLLTLEEPVYAPYWKLVLDPGAQDTTPWLRTVKFFETPPVLAPDCGIMVCGCL